MYLMLVQVWLLDESLNQKLLSFSEKSVHLKVNLDHQMRQMIREADCLPKIGLPLPIVTLHYCLREITLYLSVILCRLDKVLMLLSFLSHNLINFKMLTLLNVKGYHSYLFQKSVVCNTAVSISNGHTSNTNIPYPFVHTCLFTPIYATKWRQERQH